MLKITFPYAFPLIFYGIGGYLFRYSDRIVLEKFVPISLIGFYHIADRLSSVMKFLVNAINDALSPDYIESSIQRFEKTMEKYKNYITIWFVGICLFFLFLDMSIELYIKLFFQKEYHFVLKLVPILIASYVFRGFYCFFINPIFLLKKSFMDTNYYNFWRRDERFNQCFIYSKIRDSNSCMVNVNSF